MWLGFSEPIQAFRWGDVAFDLLFLFELLLRIYADRWDSPKAMSFVGRAGRAKCSFFFCLCFFLRLRKASSKM